LNQNSRYFFYGSPAKYALVGQEDQHIWLVLNSLELAKFISLTFESKITTVIFDLTTFENYTPELIDNSVCFNWKVPINVLHDTSVLVTDNEQIKSTVYTGSEMQLKEIFDHDILLLPANRCQELQQQLMCIYSICKKFNTDRSLFNQIKEKHLEIFQRPMSEYDEKITKLNIVYDLCVSIEAYTKPTDELISLQASKTHKNNLLNKVLI
jgi:hypothetical protein